MLAGITAGIHLIAVLGSMLGLLIILMASAATISVQDLKAINRVYLITGLALLVAAVAGCVLWLGVGKPAEFYSKNPVFHAKLGVFALLVLIIGYTGIRFRLMENTLAISSVPSSTHSNETPIAVSNSIRRLQKTCIPLLIIVPALAWMMARGIGY